MKASFKGTSSDMVTDTRLLKAGGIGETRFFFGLELTIGEGGFSQGCFQEIEYGMGLEFGGRDRKLYGMKSNLKGEG